VKMSQEFETSELPNSAPEHEHELATKEIIDLEDQDCHSKISDPVGHQIDIESVNTIKYRTCSWQKVGSSLVKDRTAR
jgi:hypothetical protein